jgi:hypothetical protein
MLTKSREGLWCQAFIFFPHFAVQSQVSAPGYMPAFFDPTSLPISFYLYQGIQTIIRMHSYLSGPYIDCSNREPLSALLAASY